MIALLLITFVIAIKFMIVGIRGTIFANFLTKCRQVLMSFYVSAAGSAFGWISGICTAAILEDFHHYFFGCMKVMIVAFLMVVMPMWSFSASFKTVDDLNEKLFRDRTLEKPTWLAGIMIFGIAVWQLITLLNK